MKFKVKQTVKFYGEKKKIAEVIKFISKYPNKIWDGDSGIEIKIINEREIFIVVDLSAVDIRRVSRRFPEVGIESFSYTDEEGGCEELFYAIGGNVIYILYNWVGFKEYWEERLNEKFPQKE